MTEEIKQEEQQQEEVQLSEHEQQALTQGWKPKDQWEGEADDWIPARQFIRNGELFGRINTYKHKIQHLEKSVDALVQHNKSVFDAGYKAAESQLKAQRRELLREGDHDGAEQVEEKLDALREERQQKEKDFTAAVKPEQANVHPSWEPWIERNTWYQKSPAMRGFADEEGQKITAAAQAAGQTVDFQKLLDEVERKVKHHFSEKFNGNGMNNQRNVKDDSEARGSRRAKADDVEAQMSQEELQIMSTIIKTGVSKEEYLKQYKQVQNRG